MPGEHQLEILQALADASALAFANVQLYGELQATIASGDALKVLLRP